MASRQRRSSLAYVEKSGRLSEVRPLDDSHPTASMHGFGVGEDIDAFPNASNKDGVESLLAAALERIAALEETQELMASRLAEIEGAQTGAPTDGYGSFKVRLTKTIDLVKLAL